ncbi:GNAT family N-acetyltransferase [Streptomyces sp. NPDC047072]|uniref:GNAT family N-acetyltransferase n=1 Tax=Streptomyces sp. NPDC047072 TaxID=3154809 RepID=UPI0033F0DEF7
MTREAFRVRPLDRDAWPDFAALIERHQDVVGGCWCMPSGEKGGEHASLVYDGSRCVGWCRFGPTAEPPAVGRWRVICFFVDRAHRHRGVASAALDGALDEIARLGGGTVESYPEDTEVALFERHGFERTRRIGGHHWVVTRTVPG